MDQYKFINEIAEKYSEDRIRQRVIIGEEVQTITSHLRDRTVLELGAGNGVVLAEICRHTDSAWGVEICSEMVNHAVVEAQSRFVQADGTVLPFEDNLFDTVVCWGNTLGPVPGEENRAALLREAFRVLKVDGVLCLGVLNRLSSAKRLLHGNEYFFHYHAKTGGWKSSRVGYNRFYTLWTLKKALLTAGFHKTKLLTKPFDNALRVIARK